MLICCSAESIFVFFLATGIPPVSERNFSGATFREIAAQFCLNFPGTLARLGGDEFGILLESCPDWTFASGGSPIC
ncbi:hypothetical protein SAMN05216299_111102 [Nitrosospira sp. Nsp14]|uniref:hypothetical protein n=1 Tax=Nitrosospira sp. Nsp14 TaxID=1855333 RepID=UPI0008DEE074|nr:hypothetical protein [Nitrosospira sp. Nsp14]SFH41809.1 hypothetical protein SAMN05216299_111102 [Nitrosospira sp. Nsp14]